MNRFACLFIVLAALLSMLSGCHRNVSEKLATIDRMCEEDIDSAVAMLHALGNPDDFSARDRAVYALMVSRVGSRGKWPVNDSIIAIAADYNWSDEEAAYRLESNMCYAELCSRLGSRDEFVDGMLRALEAERVALEMNDNEALGRIYLAMSIFYNNIGKDDDALKYSEQSIKHSKLAGIDAYRLFRQKAMLIVNMHRDAEAVAFYDSLMTIYAADSAIMVNLLFGELRSLVNIDFNRAQAEIDRLKSIDERLDKDLFQYELVLAVNQRKFDDARRYLELSREAIGNYCLGDPKGAVFYEYVIEKESGNYKRALELYSEYMTDNTGIGNSIDNMNNVVMDYRKAQAERLNKIAYKAKKRFWLAVGAIVAIVAMSIGGYYIYRRRKNNEIEHLIDTVQELSHEVKSRRNSIDALVRERFLTINSLCDDYFELSDMPGDSHLKNAIFKNVKTRIKEMSSASFRNQLAERLNDDLNGVVERFESQLPELSADDRVVFIYSAAGFSIKSIGLFLNLKKSSVYTRRRRLREAIESSQAVDKEEFISFL